MYRYNKNKTTLSDFRIGMPPFDTQEKGDSYTFEIIIFSIVMIFPMHTLNLTSCSLTFKYTL